MREFHGYEHVNIDRYNSLFLDMFEGKETGKNCEECLEISGRFSPIVGPIIRRLLSDTTDHKWVINRQVWRR